MARGMSSYRPRKLIPTNSYKQNLSLTEGKSNGSYFEVPLTPLAGSCTGSFTGSCWGSSKGSVKDNLNKGPVVF
jgi:hypothetical protein